MNQPIIHPIAVAAELGGGSKLGKQHVKYDWLHFVPHKTLYQRQDLSEKPWLPVLADFVAKSPCGSLTFLVTEYGKPFTAAGFGNWFRQQCNVPACLSAAPMGCARPGRP
jgi:hypothetical protein